MLDLCYQLQRVNLFTRKEINHHKAAIFTETNLTNARMVERERIVRFWWNLRYRPFLVSSFIYLWNFQKHEKRDRFLFHRSWGSFLKLPWAALIIFSPVFHDFLTIYDIIWHALAYFVCMIAYFLTITTFYHIIKLSSTQKVRVFQR